MAKPDKHRGQVCTAIPPAMFSQLEGIRAYLQLKTPRRVTRAEVFLEVLRVGLRYIQLADIDLAWSPSTRTEPSLPARDRDAPLDVPPILQAPRYRVETRQLPPRKTG